jgi:hypothetical protein
VMRWNPETAQFDHVSGPAPKNDVNDVFNR